MKRLGSVVFGVCVVAVSLSACGGGGAGSSSASTEDAGKDATTGPGGPGSEGGATPPHDSGPIDLGDGAPPAPTCAPPIAAVDTSASTNVVGTGTAASCTEGAFAAAVTKGGIVTFACGGPATIAITSEKLLSTKGDTVIDGGGQVTLDGGGVTRLLHFDGGNYRKTGTTVTLQHLTLAHAKASGTLIPSAPPPCSQGYEIDGGGGAIRVNDGVLHVIDCTFVEDAAASPGPDVAGGGIYATGSLGVTIVGSRFVGNTASNGGAVGCLNSDLAIANTVFSQNQATGSGANSVDTSTCHTDGGEVGNGGNGGAISIDGGSDGALIVCGAMFSRNASGALGGAIFRTPDGAAQASTLEQSTFDGNSATQGGGACYFHNSSLVITASTISNNTAPGAGGIQADGTTLTLTNDTFAGNTATKGLGGAISLFGNGGTITSCTFAGNQSSGGSGFFAAAIAGGATFTIENTLFSNNTTGDGGAPMQCQEKGTGAGDLQWPKNHVTGGGADSACVAGITFADPMLGALTANGGPTQTMLPSAASPAVGIGAACPATDQRGQPRKNSGCTAGAVELP